MRRVIGLILAGLGAFLIVVAVLLRTYVGGQLIKFPKNEYFTTTLHGHGGLVFQPQHGEARVGRHDAGHEHGQG